MNKDNQNRQSASKALNTDEISEQEKSSKTIPNGSTESNLGKRPVYLKNVIYKITNITTNKFYIGSASYYNKRIGTHIALLRQNKHNNPYFQSAWNKYGENSFTCEVLEQVESQNKLLIREQYWLDLTNCYNREIGYNISKIAGSNLGNKLSEEAKRKIGAFWKGKKFSQERIDNVRKARTLEQGKAVNVFNRQMNFICSYCSISEASRTLNVSISLISKHCSEKRTPKKKYKNSSYIFRYKDIV